jgi:hypothetical protein
MTKENLEIANMLSLKIQKLENYLIALRHTNTHLLVIRPGGISISFDNLKNLLDTNFNDQYEKEILDKLKRCVINEIDRLSIELYNL